MLYVLTIILIMASTVFYNFLTKFGTDGWEFGLILTSVVAVVSLIAAIGVHLSLWWEHANDIEQITEAMKNRKTYEKESALLIEQFKVYLADQYPTYEQQIFKHIKPENITAYMIKYPEIKANETIMKLCDEIKSCTTKIYDCNRKVNYLERKIAVRKRTIWLTSFNFLPKK